MIRSYSEFQQIEGFEERYKYLQMFSIVGVETFGHERWLNQAFYTSRQWRHIRDHVIARDMGNDLGVDGRPVFRAITIHHMNPIAARDIIDGNPDILNPEFLISVSLRTHNAIHYGDASILEKPFEPRRQGDTRLW